MKKGTIKKFVKENWQILLAAGVGGAVGAALGHWAFKSGYTVGVKHGVQVGIECHKITAVRPIYRSDLTAAALELMHKDKTTSKFVMEPETFKSLAEAMVETANEFKTEVSE